ncbi:MAG TPA: hypothetical protein IAA29_15605 [Candidatus Paenibacillus intestinavium]|nr:hypothetical protein [Candidatus Paenibacillus intestinavium]
MSNTLLQNNHRYQSLFFELPLKMKVQKTGFQNRAGEALLEQGGSANVRYRYMRTVLAKFASDAMSNTLRQHHHRYQSLFFELPLKPG